MSRLPRHVAVNALFYDPGRSGGPETYLRGLVPALAAAAPGMRLTVVTTRRGAARLHEDGWTDFCSVVALRADEGERLARLAAEVYGFQHAAAGRGCDLLHPLIATGPLRSRIPTVATLHDLTFLRQQTFSRATTLALRFLVVGTVRGAREVITGSEAARQEILDLLDLPPERIHVVYHGAGRPAGGPAATPDAVRTALGLPPGPIVLCVAAVRPHKNQVQLVDAAAQLPSDVQIVLCGQQEPYAETVAERARELGVADRVHLTGYVDDAVLEGLWGMAACAAFPTSAEGFGLPVAEAMHRDVPVACADIDVLREVGGDAAHYFPLGDGAAAAAAIGAAIDDRRHAGPQRARRFTWEACAAGTLDAYARALR